MLKELKKLLYFPAANYFKFFAGIRLRRWNPRIILITGSNGKTTLLHLMEAQLGEKAKYSHNANSSFGIPFDILGMGRATLLKSEWLKLFLLAPFNALKRPPGELLYVVEADCDRPGEGKFLAEFLRPEVVLWTNTARTHGVNFELVALKRSGAGWKPAPAMGRGDTIEEAIAYEFGFFLEYCREMAVVNGDNLLEKKQIGRTNVKVVEIKKHRNLEEYKLEKNETVFRIKGEKFSFKALLPEEVFYSVAMCREAVKYLNLPFDNGFSRFVMPPGRSSLFKGIKGTTIVDSCYNADLSSMKAVLNMFDKLAGKNRWVVVGDMLEQGEGERAEHEKLAELLSKYDFERIILMGPRVGQYVYPILDQKSKIKDQNQNLKLKTKNLNIEKFLGPKETLEYLIKNIRGGEVILFKGARFMEGIIENLLEDKSDVSKLARREKVWQKRRKAWGI